MNFRPISFLFLLFLSVPCHSQDRDRSKDLLTFAAFEGGLALHSWLLSRSPRGYGVLSGLIYPLTGIESSREAPYWTSLAAAESMNLYNLSMDNKGYTGEEIFKRNLIGWHIVFGITIASHVLLKKETPGHSFMSNTLRFVPTEHGGELRIDYKF